VRIGLQIRVYVIRFPDTDLHSSIMFYLYIHEVVGEAYDCQRRRVLAEHYPMCNKH
jgi:hypothetical protein